MALDMQNPITLLRVDGGMTKSEELMQIQADISGVDLVRPAMLETTALGAALAAGIAVGVWPSLGIFFFSYVESFANGSQADRFSPKSTQAQRTLLQSEWRRAIEKSFW